MYPPVSLLLDLHDARALRRLYDNPAFISTEPRLRRLRELAGYLAAVARAGRPALRGWRPAGGCDQLASRA